MIHNSDSFMDPCYFNMNGAIPVHPEMTPPLESCGLFNDHHAYDAMPSPPAIVPDRKPATPESLPLPSPGRRRSVATTTTGRSISANTNSRPVKQCTRRVSDSFSPLCQQPREPSTAGDIVFSPRPVEDLHAERAYLSTSLFRQSLHAEGLIRDYSSALRQLQACEESSTHGKVRRQLKKQLNLLKLKIHKVGSQERAIGSRLGEVGVELQSREAWDREKQRCFFPLLVDTSSSVGSWSDEGHQVFSTTSMSYMTSPETPLNALSPSFVPGKMYPWSLAEEDETGIDAVVADCVEKKVVEEFACNHGLTFSYCCRVEADEGAGGDEGDCRRLSVGGPDSAALVKRRLSLPNMSSLWVG